MIKTEHVADKISWMWKLLATYSLSVIMVLLSSKNSKQLPTMDQYHYVKDEDGGALQISGNCLCLSW